MGCLTEDPLYGAAASVADVRGLPRRIGAHFWAIQEGWGLDLMSM